MGHRLSKIYTRTGDDGTTGLANGERVDKADPRVGAFGDVDETNSALGLLLAEPGLPRSVATTLTRIQHELFEIGAELSLPGYRQITGEHVARLERDLDTTVVTWANCMLWSPMRTMKVVEPLIGFGRLLATIPPRQPALSPAAPASPVRQTA